MWFLFENKCFLTKLSNASGRYKQNSEFSTQKWLKGHQRSNLAQQKLDVTRSTICMENFILVSKTAQGWYHATLLIIKVVHDDTTKITSLNYYSKVLKTVHKMNTRFLKFSFLVHTHNQVTIK